MTIACNYDDVVAQLCAAGLILKGPIEINTTKPVRCYVEGEREKRGWYWLSDVLLDRALADGGVTKEPFIVGAYGVYQGLDNGKRKIELPKSQGQSLSDDQRAAIKAQHAEKARRLAAAEKAEAERAARRAQYMWAKCAPEGESGYLARKQVGAHGVRYTPSGALVVPMCDGAGKVWGLQFILDKSNAQHARRIAQTGRDKEYWPKHLTKQGRYHLIGGFPGEVVLLAEGYATAATLYAATGLPVAVAFDAGNLLPVAQAVHKRYPRARILICADDDYLTKCHAKSGDKKCGTYSLATDATCRACGAPLPAGNAGVTQASAAALAVSGEWLAPRFARPRPIDTKGATDYNDLHLSEGLHLVRAQVEAKLDAAGWRARPSAAAESSVRGGGSALKSLLTIDEACERYTIIYGGKSTIFDHQEHMLVPKADVLDILPEHGWRTWKDQGPRRRIARLDEVGFDPTGKDARIKCNLWGGWPTSPRAGNCDNLLDLLHYLCAHEDNPAPLADWVLKWLAYPIQHPGAKMKTALVFHGPQGVGKNLFFEAIMAIYGEYGRVIDQHAIEDKFNDWASRKLFLVADEVVARAELYHTKNKLKAFVTGDWIRINPKNVAAHDERNHVNVVFLSNETQPLQIERDDRRYTVVWTPDKLPRDVYRTVGDEIKHGGVAALHHYLLHLPLGDFAPWTEPPVTRAKSELIELSMDSTERFWRLLKAGQLENVPLMPCKSEQLYDLYRAWSTQQGMPRYAPMHQLLAMIGKRTDAKKMQARYMNGSGPRMATFVIPANADPPADKTQAAWLGECVMKFGDAVTWWREEHGRRA